jgi:Fe-S-cluster-containing dehydrogenase component/DMSO reductase anchor subunit
MSFIGSQGSTPMLDRGPTRGTILPDDGLIGSFLEEQWDLSAVERFAQFHENAEEPLQGRYYSTLMPARPPGPGQQYAFEVDLDRCSGCKACVAACHNLNGLDEGESWREVGLVIGGLPGLPILQHVTTACHHCLDPACLNACPVDAYEKDPVTGIVRHLDDQCFGCQYCTLACPYDAPKFHAGKGIVRKCDMCGDRLAAGEAPACVQACPHGAIVIRVVDRGEIVERAEASAFLPGAPDPRFTLPTTSFRSRHLLGQEDVRTEDAGHVEPEPAHWPLIAMLVLTQLSVGGFLVELIAAVAGSRLSPGTALHPVLCLVLAWAGLAGSVLHLGRPLYAYRAIIGLWHSWLSREVLAFGVFAALATIYVGLDVLRPTWLAGSAGLRVVLLGSVVATGFAGVGASMMVYHAVRRPFWNASYVGIKFAGTAAVLGLATALASLSTGAVGRPGPPSGVSSVPLWSIALGLMAITSGKLWYERRLSHFFSLSKVGPLQQTALLLRGALKRPARLRFLLGFVGGIVVPGLAMASTAWGHPGLTAALAILALAASIGAESIERYLFFTAVVRPKMPGGLLP